MRIVGSAVSALENSLENKKLTLSKIRRLEMNQFAKNFNYISECLSKIRGTKTSTGDLSKIFTVARMAAYSYLKGRHIPNTTTLQFMIMVLEREFSWKITVEELKNYPIHKKYNVDKIISQSEQFVASALEGNIEKNLDQIGQRLELIRKQKKWTLMNVSAKSKEYFPQDETYHISHSHIRDIELGHIKNYHVNKMRALASIYGKSLEYILMGKTDNKKFSIDNVNNSIIIPLNPDYVKKSKQNSEEIAESIYNTLKAIEPGLIYEYNTREN